MEVVFDLSLHKSKRKGKKGKHNRKGKKIKIKKNFLKAKDARQMRNDITLFYFGLCCILQLLDLE